MAALFLHVCIPESDSLRPGNEDAELWPAPFLRVCFLVLSYTVAIVLHKTLARPLGPALAQERTP